MKLLDARYVIPMHYWDPQDRDTFLAMLNGVADSHGRSYEVHATSEAEFELLQDRGDSPVAVQVLGLTLGPLQVTSSSR